jgi:hypothetical protein
VVVTPAGILAALMLYFFPQYIQVIAFVPVFCRPDFAGSGFSAFVGAAALGINEIACPQALHRVLDTPSGMALGLTLYCLLQY